MPMLIQAVRIANFRGLKNIEVHLDRRTVLIGTNNAGKTSFHKALQVAFGETRFVVEDDFHVDTNGNRSDEILVDVRLVPTGEDRTITEAFDRIWGGLFRSDIQNDGDQEFVAIRTRISRKDDQKRFSPVRVYLKEWPAFHNWTNESYETSAHPPGFSFSEAIPFLFQDAQRDILEDVRMRTSFIGRVLSKVEYSTSDMQALKAIIDELNKEAVDKSEVLSSLQTYLGELGGALGGSGKTEISSVAKDVRDLTKGIRLHYQDGQNSFSMEYHGMGTRSWASLLALKAFAKIVEKERQAEKKPFFPILALEEPEAHLHPNAQKQLYRQINDFPGQVVVSTHSPYIAAQVGLVELRGFYRLPEATVVGQFTSDLESEDARRIAREVVNTRGELFFSKLIILIEGETEEQALPLYFEKYFGMQPFERGVNFVGVGGSGNYKAFLRFATALNIPWLIFSDGEIKTLKKVKTDLEQVTGKEVDLESDPKIIILPDGLNYEGYLLQCGYAEEIEKGIETIEGKGWVQKRIEKLDGQPQRPEMTDDICDKCEQHIFVGPRRNYRDSEGRLRALNDFMDSEKTKYAIPIAKEILALDETRQFPEKVKNLLVKIESILAPKTNEEEEI